MYNIIHAKATAFRLSDQVISILHSKGFSAVFNYPDYEYFKRQCKSAYDKAHAIAELFIQDNADAQNDFNDYVF